MDYKATLHLPSTEFPMKADLQKREPERLARWEGMKLYERILEQNKDGERFLLHDGPPYANGNIHIGHVLNKVLKDLVVRYRALTGRRAAYLPGWDCHGLPIELAVEKELGSKRRELSPVEVRRACRAYAERMIDTQRGEFKRLGIMGQWDDPYLTMDYRYEATIAREIGRFAEAGSLYRAKMPVFWCASCATALAEAEVEYEDKDSPSIYVAFKANKLPTSVSQFAGKLSVVIWTTTPWTLIANLAICLNKELDYVVLRGRSDDEALLVAEGLAEKAAAAMNLGAPAVLAKVAGEALEGLVCRHPFIERDSPILFGEHVTLEAGTGCVHTAPGHGVEDFVIGRQHGLPPYAPVDRRGRFTDEAGEDFYGLSIHDANPKVAELLASRGALLNKVGEKLRHSYPHCWRCKKPVLFRATEQWFISLSHNELRGKALDEIDRVEWIPAWGRDRIHGMVENRPDWCVSRQRLWGVPIPAFHCESCGHATINHAIVEHVSALFEKEGADAWFSRELHELLPPGQKCAQCEGEAFTKENDILDVWFDSGVSFSAVVEEKMNEALPCELYLEGNDQHRGWFHSSLLAAVGTRGRAPYKAVLTHGMVVDHQGRKMSKSQGNVVAPAETIDKMGAEILRLWVATQDYRDDNPVSQEILKNVAEAYRKIRNTGRFLLSNLHGFDPTRDEVEHSALGVLDRWTLHRLARLVERTRDAYERYEFHRVHSEILAFCSVDLSSLYLDVTKDKLYCLRADDPARRAIQTVMYRVARTLAVLAAPVLVFTADELWQHLPGATADDSVHLARFPAPQTGDLDEALDADIAWLRELRTGVDGLLEEARREKKLGASLGAWVTVPARDDEEAARLQKYEGLLADFLIVSKATIERGPGPIRWAPAPGPRCERCWRFVSCVAAHGDEHPALCARCAGVLGV